MMIVVVVVVVNTMDLHDIKIIVVPGSHEILINTHVLIYKTYKVSV